MRATVPSLSLFLLLGACAPRAPFALGGAVQGSQGIDAVAFVRSIPQQLEAGGPAIWIQLFDESEDFYMASDGALAFASPDSAAAFLRSFAPTVQSIELQWTALRVEHLSADLASFASPYREAIRMEDGSVSRFGGYVTGVVRRRRGTWRIQHLHWSSPTEQAE